MASCSSPSAAPKRQCVSSKIQKVYSASKAIRQSNRIQAATIKNTTNNRSDYGSQPRGSIPESYLRTQGNLKQPATAKKRPRNSDSPISQHRKRLRLQYHSQPKPCEQPRDDNKSPRCIPPERPLKQSRTSPRVNFWVHNKVWPTAEQQRREEGTMDRYRDLIEPAMPRKKSSASLRRKRSDASISTVRTRTPSDQLPREQKSAPYRHPRYESQLSERGSFMTRYKHGITANSRELCQKLLDSPQLPPKGTLFEDDLLEDTLDSVRGRNETRVIRDIAQLIVPSAEIQAIRGAQHLSILRETTNTSWNNAIPFYESRPQPDYSLGFKREAFTKDQLYKLQPFIGNDLEDCSFFAATYDMYFPFLTSEVKCGASALDIADRQNCHSQTISLRGLFELFRIVGRQNELHSEIKAWSISHSDVEVRIWGHVLVIDGDELKFYREPIAKFYISKTAQADNRWVAWTMVMNLLDLWITDHFKWICSAVDQLPADLDFEVPELSGFAGLDPDLASSQSGLSQRLETYSLIGDQTAPDSQPSVQLSTPATTAQTKTSNSRKKKAR